MIIKNRGQATLVIVVIVMVVSLAVGVAASNRAISNIKRVSYTSQSDQALHCAESGAEVALNQIAEDLESGSDPLRSGVGPISLTDTKVPPTSICSYNYTVSEFIAKASLGGTLDYPLVKQDDAQEVNLEGYSGDVDFYFGSDDTASLELTFVKGSSPPYSIEKYAYYCLSPNDFENGSGGGNGTLPCGASFSASDYKIVRMRPLYADTSVVVKFGNDSPPQGYVIDSMGKADTVERKVRVIRTKPQLPAVFDYAIFSEGPLKKP